MGEEEWCEYDGGANVLNGERDDNRVMSGGVLSVLDELSNPCVGNALNDDAEVGLAFMLRKPVILSLAIVPCDGTVVATLRSMLVNFVGLTNTRFPSIGDE